jgi:hypothetical protein
MTPGLHQKGDRVLSRTISEISVAADRPSSVPCEARMSSKFFQVGQEILFEILCGILLR